MMKTLMVVSAFLLTVTAQNDNNTNTTRANTTVTATTSTETPATNQVCSRETAHANPRLPVPLFPFNSPTYLPYNPSFISYSNTQIPYRPPIFPMTPSPSRRSREIPTLRTSSQQYNQWIPMQQFPTMRNPSEPMSSQWVPIQPYSSQQYPRRPSYPQTGQGVSLNGAAYQSYGQNYEEMEPVHQEVMGSSQLPPILQRPVQQVYYQAPTDLGSGAYQYENGGVVQQMPMHQIQQAPVQQVYYRAPSTANGQMFRYDNGFVQQVPVQQVLVMN